MIRWLRKRRERHHLRRLEEFLRTLEPQIGSIGQALEVLEQIETFVGHEALGMVGIHLSIAREHLKTTYRDRILDSMGADMERNAQRFRLRVIEGGK